ncbi:hypothetical protein B0H66DRAFT_635071 [Apodospora peruviana]|uniref:DUF7708 domain-containing protein n=1 Tax=Apodospora peruviana TaxID=516989 RepID=A0AAE0IS51_9PEZI|nr:hypothetical protein B0H66DRAFT_635071 [Apodospora peruviana]
MSSRAQAFPPYNIQSITMPQMGDNHQHNGKTEGKKAFSQQNFDKIKKCEEKQKLLRNRAGESRKFTEEERSALDVDSQENFKNFWETTLDAKVAFDTEHDDGPGRLAHEANHLAASAYDLLQKVSPLIDIVKNFGAPYGGMAIGTICFLFAVAKSRSTMENKVLSTLLDIQDRLPGVKMYQHIYNDDHELDQQLQSKIVDAYNSFIDFCIVASHFYTGGSFRRWIRAMGGSSSVDEQASCVQKAVVDVRLVCEELLSKNVEIVKNDLKKVQQQNTELKEEIIGENPTCYVPQSRPAQGYAVQLTAPEMQNDHDLEAVRTLLGLQAVSERAKVAQFEAHRRNVAVEFEQSDCCFETTLAQRLRAIEEDRDYKDWLESPRSQLLVLEGRNEVIEASHCWASAVALNLIAKLADAAPSSNPYAFYLLGLRDREESSLDVLSNLILQLLSLKTEAPRDRAQFSELRAELEEYARMGQPSHLATHYSAHRLKEKLQEIALRAVNLFSEETTVWIILDRVDHCRVVPELRQNSRRRDGRALLQSMVHLVEKAAVTIKVLAVINRVDWHADRDDLEAKQEESVIIREFSQQEDI